MFEEKPKIKENISNKVVFTKEEIAELEKEHGELLQLDLVDEETGNTLTFLFVKKVKKSVIKFANAKVSETKNAGDYIDTILNNVLVNGQSYLEDGSIYLAIQSKMDSYLNRYKGDFVKKN